MNPAALNAALSGDFVNALAASTPGGIERQEAEGQKSFVASATLPKDMMGTTREQLEAIGFKFGADADDLFVNCTLPPGWTKRATDHSMWSDLLDEQGRKRGGIFYKAAFYDRNAHMSMNRRYSVHSYEPGSQPQSYQVRVMDGDTEIKNFGEVVVADRAGYDAKDALVAKASAWLDAHHPGWQSPFECW